jgi:phenylpropionate dioxygenase-like ring-hydroxylating dioxygenase large terminal subunit
MLSRSFSGKAMVTLRDYWYIAAPSREVGRRPLQRVVEGETLVLFRDSAGRVQALIDRCAHRGMALSRGRVVGDCVECPYHGWQYDGAGSLRAVPALCAGERLPQPRSMRAYPVQVCDEHIWVWIGDDAPRAGPWRFPHCGERGWETCFLHTRFEAPIEACLENFLDVPHTLLVHPGLFRSPHVRPTRACVTRFADSVEAEFLDEQPLTGIGPRLVFPRGTVMRHTDRFILPSITRVDYTFGDDHALIITSQCTQREEYVVDVTTAITWRLPLPRIVARPFIGWYCRRVIRQDVEILKILGEQIRRFGRVQTSTSADLLGRHIGDLRKRAADGLPSLPVEAAIVRQETVLKI